MTDPNAPEPTTPDPAPEPEPTAPDPTSADLAALVAQVNSMQAQLNEARGIPTDPVGAAVKALKDHVTARFNSGIGAFGDLKDAIEKAGDTVESKTSDLFRTMAGDIRDHVEGAAYIKQLASDLHKNVLTAA